MKYNIMHQTCLCDIFLVKKGNICKDKKKIIGQCEGSKQEKNGAIQGIKNISIRTVKNVKFALKSLLEIENTVQSSVQFSVKQKNQKMSAGYGKDVSIVMVMGSLDLERTLQEFIGSHIRYLKVNCLRKSLYVILAIILNAVIQITFGLDIIKKMRGIQSKKADSNLLKIKRQNYLLVQNLPINKSLEFFKHCKMVKKLKIYQKNIQCTFKQFMQSNIGEIGKPYYEVIHVL
jgi:hypothetical protein